MMKLLKQVRPCPHENRFSHPNRFHPDLLCPSEGCKSLLEPCWFSPASALSNGELVCMESVSSKTASIRSG